MGQFEPTNEEVLAMRESTGLGAMQCKSLLTEQAKSRRLEELLTDAEYMWAISDTDTCESKAISAMLCVLKILVRGEE